MNRYRKGADKERELVNQAKGLGMLAFRSAGSHSPIDVVVIDRETNHIWLVQSKSAGFKGKEKLEEEYNWLNGNWKVRFMVK